MQNHKNKTHIKTIRNWCGIVFGRSLRRSEPSSLGATPTSSKAIRRQAKGTGPKLVYHSRKTVAKLVLNSRKIATKELKNCLLLVFYCGECGRRADR